MIENTAWQKLRALHAKKCMPGGLLLIGHSQEDNKILVNGLVGLMQCLSASDQSCHHCRSCHLLANQSHPDVQIFDAESGISIDDIRDITGFFQQTPHYHAKITVILNVDLLSMIAGHALLKTLEEPTPHSQMILTARHLSGVLPTITSRCLRLFIPSTSPTPEITPAFLNALLSGNPNVFWRDDTQQFISEEPLKALYLFYYWVNSLIRVKMGYPGFTINSSLDPQQMEKILDKIEIRQLFEFLERVVEALQSLSLPGINKLLVLESLFLKWQALKDG